MLKFSEDTQLVLFRSEPEQRFKLKKAVEVYRSWAEANRTVLSPCVFVSVSVCVAARAICCAATPADPGTQWTVSGIEGFHRWQARPPAAAHAYVDPKNTQVKQWTCEHEATHLFLFVCKKKQKCLSSCGSDIVYSVCAVVTKCSLVQIISVYIIQAYLPVTCIRDSGKWVKNKVAISKTKIKKIRAAASVTPQPPSRHTYGINFKILHSKSFTTLTMGWRKLHKLSRCNTETQIDILSRQQDIILMRQSIKQVQKTPTAQTQWSNTV